MIDTHSHIFSEEFKEDLSEVIARAKEIGVEKIFMPNIDDTSVEDMLNVCQAYPDYCFPMIGFHPTSVEGPDAIYKVREMKKHLVEGHPYIAVGEVGLDLYWDKTFEKQQVEVLTEQLRWAKQLHLPVALHTREAFDLMFKVLEQEQDGGLSGVFHCFNGTEEQANIAISLGFHLGLGGVITYKNCDVKNYLANISLDKIILETDDPYLPPVPYRGKRNEISYMTEVAKKIAEVKQIDIKEVAEATSNNARQLFNL